uniref:Putative secreted protein n=1 Tax=Anopheles darlingi TaxID=43151 RepID=A0A2M4D8E7_ANODA
MGKGTQHTLFLMMMMMMMIMVCCSNDDGNDDRGLCYWRAYGCINLWRKCLYLTEASNNPPREVLCNVGNYL